MEPRAANARREDSAAQSQRGDLQLLLRIRNDLAFHYSPKVLPRAYQATFADPTQRYRDRAVLSDGESMEATRFYFADAAMEEGLRVATGLDMATLQRTLSGITDHVNKALKFIVTRYIRESARLSPYSPRP